MIRKNQTRMLGYQKISKQSLILWELLFLVGWSGLFGFMLWLFLPGTWLWFLLVFSMGVFLLLVSFLYLPALYHAAGYCMTDRFLVYRHGLFFQRQQLIHRDQIVYVSVFRNPVTPTLKISSLVVATPGAKLRIPFLNDRVARELAEQLSPSPKKIY